MQSKIMKSDSMVLLPVSLELLEEIGLNPLDVIQFSVSCGKLIIEKVTDDDFECDGDCDSCPLFDEDCDGDCETCPCYAVCDENEEDYEDD